MKGLENKGQGDPDGSSLLLMLVAGSLLVVVVIFAVEAFYLAHKRAFEEQASVGAYSELQRSVEEQKKHLGSYSWKDREQGRVTIPVDRAMDLVIEEGLSSR